MFNFYSTKRKRQKRRNSVASKMVRLVGDDLVRLDLEDEDFRVIRGYVGKFVDTSSDLGKIQQQKFLGRNTAALKAARNKTYKLPYLTIEAYAETKQEMEKKMRKIATETGVARANMRREWK